MVKAGTGQPLRGARISFRRMNVSQGPLGNARTPVTTDAAGRFLVTGVDPGQYRISADRDGYIRQEFGQRTAIGPGSMVSVQPGQRLEIQFQMLPAAVISGRVLDEQGEPLARLTVQAWTHQYSEGRRSLVQAANGQTNDIGEYRLFWLSPGEYFVSATVPNGLPGTGETATANLAAPDSSNSGRIAASLATVIGNAGGLPGGVDGEALQKVLQALDGPEPAQIYFPGTANPDGAAPIKIGPAADMRAIDFNLRPIRTVSVRGRVVSPVPVAAQNAPTERFGPGILVQGAQVSLAREGAKAALASLGVGGTPVNADGTFEFRGVAAGSYVLTALVKRPDGPTYTARTRVEAGDTDVTNVVLGVRPGIDIGGRVMMDSPPQDFRITQLRVALVPSDGLGIDTPFPIPGIGGATTQVAADGTFMLQNVGAREYRLRVTGLPPGMYLVAGRLGSLDVLNGPFVPVDNKQTRFSCSLVPRRAA